MKMIWSIKTGVTCVLMAAAPAAGNSRGPMTRTEESVTQKFAHELPNAPGKSLIAVEISYAPGGKSRPHHHAKSGFIWAYVLAGAIRSQVAGEPLHIYRSGQDFYENPSSHHLVAENASDSEPAKLLAVFVVDTDDKNLTTPDK